MQEHESAAEALVRLEGQKGVSPPRFHVSDLKIFQHPRSVVRPGCGTWPGERLCGYWIMHIQASGSILAPSAPFRAAGKPG